MRWRSIVTALFTAVGAGIGVAVGGVGGLFLGGSIGYLAGRVGDLRSRLVEVEQAHAETRQIVLSQPPPAPAETSTKTEEPPRVPSEPSDRPPPPEPPPEPAPELDPFPWTAPADRPIDVGPLRADEPGTPVPAQPKDTGEPPVSLGQKLFDAVKIWLTTGNAPVKVGAIVLLVGVGLLIREASRRGIFTLTIEVRLIAVAVFALILLAMGWRQRERRPIYGRSLQGAAIAVLYLTTYAAFEVYDLIPTAVAAVVVILVTVGAGVLAVTQDARILAVLGIIGGFLAPVLSYSRPGDYVVVFSFYTVLSAAIIAVAWFKVWPSLNLLGLAFNFGIAAFWLLGRYAEEDWPSVQPFIATFVLMYMVLPVLFAVREPPSIRRPWTASLVFGAPFMGLGLQYLVIGHTSHGVAVSALVLMGLEIVLYVVARRLGEDVGELAEALAALGIAFAAIAVPLWLGAYYITVAWALQGAILLWFGCRRSRGLAIAGGALLQFMAAVAFATHLADTLSYDDGVLVILTKNFANFAAAALLAVTGLASGVLFRRCAAQTSLRSAMSWLAMVWGVGWWLAGGLLEIAYRLPSWQLPVALAFVVASLGAAAWAAERARWYQLNVLGVLILPTLAIVLGLSIVEVSHPLGRYGWAAWPVALIVYYWFLRIRDGVLGVLLATLHAGGFWVLAALIAAEVHWQVGRVAGDVWMPVAALGAVLLLVAGTLRARRWSTWPCGPHGRVYVTGVVGPMLIVVAMALFVMNLLLDGDPAPFLYVPVFNPLEMLMAPVLAVAFAWRRAAAAEGDHALQGLVDSRWALTLAPTGIVVATMSVARTIHHWRDVPWEFVALARSTELQAALSIVWAVIALATMVIAVRLARRAVWMAGASFMGLVVAKLFFVDLSSLGAVTRVVAFLGVGALLVVVGYFAPVVPAATAHEAEDRSGDRTLGS